MPSAIQIEIARLVLTQRWAAIATLNETSPLASMVAYAPEPGLDGLVMLLSQLSLHTRNLLTDPRASIAITQPDTAAGDPQLLARASLQGTVDEIPRGHADFAKGGALYAQRFPDALPRFELGDFRLLRFIVDEVRYVGGFARAVSLSGDQLREAAKTLQASEK